ncbi:binding-protein-dependent transport systems inner membrane component [Thermoanaerobacter pseudethanolicus ATCC 33223]|jgi:raffinose/stachyose/melibiose transport system permease protein|uniref:Binding-protein-dependent transport systems inner membrane component n=1 Tax=Thermoanaerobacter pseudethanolicus (strain ATCC 33223 / 39E) TaxID=340099 RepID=B0K7P1_THEP3|nr:binding-protein-dependent transport systems inner membrane component [Thermoanaerobacter pseudethanolicus ATCC 33223]
MNVNQEKTLLAKLKTYLIFAGPTTFAFLTVIILPFLYGIYLTFTDWNGISATHAFVGFSNYLQAFNDKVFWTSFLLTLKYVFFTVILINVIAFFLAYMLTSGVKGQNFFRAGFFTPNLIGGILLGFIWQFIFSNILVYLGKSYNIPIFSGSWLSDPDKAFWALVIVTVWQYTGYMMVIYISGFMNIPRDLLEAASIDGANFYQRLKNVILPLMAPSFTISVFLTLQRGFMVYDINLALTNGGPYKSTELISLHIYNTAFLSQQYGIGQAEAFFLFFVVAAVTLLQVYFSKKLEVEN